MIIEKCTRVEYYDKNNRKCSAKFKTLIHNDSEEKINYVNNRIVSKDEGNNLFLEISNNYRIISRRNYNNTFENDQDYLKILYKRIIDFSKNDRNNNTKEVIKFIRLTLKDIELVKRTFNIEEEEIN